MDMFRKEKMFKIIRIIKNERLREISRKHNLAREGFSAEREFREPISGWQDTGRGYLVTHLAMVDVSNKDGVGFPENKFNAVISDAQPKFLKISIFQFDYFSMLKRMIEFANLFNFSHNARLFFDGEANQFLFSGWVEEIIEHKNSYLEDFSRFSSRFSTSLAGSQEPVRSADFTRAAVSLIDSSEDNSIKSTTSSNNSLERTLDEAITPRRFLLSIIVRGNNLFIQIKHTIQKVVCQVPNNSSACASIPNYTDELNAKRVKVIYFKE